MVPSVPAPALPADSSVWDNPYPSAIGSPGIDKLDEAGKSGREPFLDELALI